MPKLELFVTNLMHHDYLTFDEVLYYRTDSCYQGQGFEHIIGLMKSIEPRNGNIESIPIGTRDLIDNSTDYDITIISIPGL